MNLALGLVAAWSLLTRIPVSVTVEARHLRSASGWFPGVGLGLGLLLALVAELLGPLLGQLNTALVLVAGLGLLTGGLHLDGLADTFDAAGGNRGRRDRALLIMADARIGAHGASALVLVLLLKVHGLSRCIDLGLGAIVSGPLLGRYFASVLSVALAPAKDSGLAQGIEPRSRFVTLLLASLSASVAAVSIGVPLLAPLLCCGVAVGLLAAWSKRRIGGVTGDIYGAAIELCEGLAWLAAPLSKPASLGLLGG